MIEVYLKKGTRLYNNCRSTYRRYIRTKDRELNSTLLIELAVILFLKPITWLKLTPYYYNIQISLVNSLYIKYRSKKLLLL